MNRAQLLLLWSQELVGPTNHLLYFTDTLHTWTTQLSVDNASVDKLSFHWGDREACQARLP